MGIKGELLRQRIVEAADQLFYQQGYEKTSFNDIASAVNISRGNFYYHFKSKDEILSAVIDNRMSGIKQMICQWEQEYPDAKQSILFYIDILCENQENIEKHGCPIGGMCSELSKLNHASQSDANSMYVVFRDWLTEKFKQLGQGKKSPQLAMHLLARTQGIATISHSFEDRRFLLQEVKLLKQWLDDVTA